MPALPALPALPADDDDDAAAADDDNDDDDDTPAVPALPAAAAAEPSGEVLLLQRVWRHLAASADLEATVGSAVLLRFLRAALAPPDDSAKPNAPAAPGAPAPATPPAADPQLFADFAVLWRNTLSYKSIRNVRAPPTEADAQGCDRTYHGGLQPYVLEAVIVVPGAATVRIRGCNCALQVRGHTEQTLQSEADECTFNPTIDKRSRRSPMATRSPGVY